MDTTFAKSTMSAASSSSASSSSSSLRPPASSNNLFQVYLRLRPPPVGSSGGEERILSVVQPEQDGGDEARPSHITLNPPTDRRRAVERFAFTRVFDEDATQLDVFHCADIASLAEGVLAPRGGDGTDAVVATLGVTGSGKVRRKQTAPLFPLSRFTLRPPRWARAEDRLGIISGSMAGWMADAARRHTPSSGPSTSAA